jgi:hypothetical protein
MEFFIAVGVLFVAWYLFGTLLQHLPEPPVHPAYRTRTPDKPILEHNPMRNGDMFMSSADKLAYLSSHKWHSIRNQVLERDNHCCQSCSATHNLQCHHLNYSNFGDELLSDLTILCKDCHNTLHILLGYDRKSHFDISILRIQNSLKSNSSLNT